jgi:hypothetical protein
LNPNAVIPVAIFTRWIPRVDRLCDLFDAGAVGAVETMIGMSAPPARPWPYTRRAIAAHP